MIPEDERECLGFLLFSYTKNIKNIKERNSFVGNWVQWVTSEIKRIKSIEK